MPMQIDTVLGDRKPTLDDLKKLRLTTRVINEAMRLYPQPPVLIRRATEDDVLGGFSVAAGSDIFISVWNIHRCAEHTAGQGHAPRLLSECTWLRSVITCSIGPCLPYDEPSWISYRLSCETCRKILLIRRWVTLLLLHTENTTCCTM